MMDSFVQQQSEAYDRGFKVWVLFISSEFRVGAGHMDDSMKFQRVSADSR